MSYQPPFGPSPNSVVAPYVYIAIPNRCFSPLEASAKLTRQLPVANVETGTGVIIALILALCHVSDETIADEYSLTEIGLASRKEEIIQRLIRPGEALEGDREKAERMVSARYV